VIVRLTEDLNIEAGDVVAFVGGGGKSTLVLEIGRELAKAGQPVVMGTTTKMGVEQIPAWAQTADSLDAARAAVNAGRPVYLLRHASGAKVIGVAPGLVDRVASTTGATVIIEADGSRRRPFKAPAAHEPVVPKSSNLVVMVAGIDALGTPIAAACHRPERVCALTGRAESDPLRPDDIAAVASHPRGGRKGVPPGARLVLAVTKTTDRDAAAVEQIRAALPGDIELVTFAAR